MASLPGLPNGPNTALCAPSLLRHCRSASELGAEADPRGPFKFARMDTFSARHADFESQMAARALLLNSSARSDGNSGNSSSSSLSPGGSLRGYNPCNLQVRPSKADDVGSLFQIFAGGSQTSVTRAGSSPFLDVIPSQVPSAKSDGARYSFGGRSGPFTAEQLLEFKQQTCIFKHLAAGVKPPPALVLPIVSNISTNNRFGANSLHIGSNAAAVFGTGPHGSTDPEPGRCRRTDGKKWRCARDVVQDQKYCERHMHRGRHRSRTKNVETQAVTTSPSTGAAVPSASNAPADSTDGTSVVEKAVCGSNSTINRLSPLSQQVMSLAAPASNPHPQPFSPPSLQGLSSAVLPKINSASSLPFSREGKLQFSLLPSGTFDDANRGLRHVNSNLRSDQFISSDASDLKRLLGQGAGSSSMRNLIPPKHLPNQLCNMAPANESLSDMFAMSHARNHFNVDNADKSEVGSRRVLAPPVDLGGLNGVREADDLPFRQFMNDWPRSRDSPSWCDLDEQQNSSKTASSTELSMSNQMTLNLPLASMASSRPKLPASPLRLSMMKTNGDDLLGESAVDMGLSMGVGVANANEPRDQQQSNWIPIAWDSPLVGGPLAEVLHSRSSTPRGHSSSSLNLLGDNWEHHHQLQPGSPKESNSASLASPTDVLQKTVFGSYADSSSSGSSPRSAPKVESRFCDTA